MIYLKLLLLKKDVKSILENTKLNQDMGDNELIEKEFLKIIFTKKLKKN